MLIIVEIIGVLLLKIVADAIVYQKGMSKEGHAVKGSKR